MAYRVDCDGNKLEIEKRGDELYFTMYHHGLHGECFMEAYVKPDELNSVLRMLEEQD